MTEEKKTKKPRRPAAEIAAEKKAWLARHEWSGPKKALEIVSRTRKELEDAQAACAERVPDVSSNWKEIIVGLEHLEDGIALAIPLEAQ